MPKTPKPTTVAKAIPKSPTGIVGLDEITEGGLPRGRPTLVCGGPGSGKTLMAVEFLVRGARQFGEPGLFVSFEENTRDLAANFAGLGFDLPSLVDSGKIAIEHIRIQRSEVVEAGEYDLEGLFVRIAHAVESIGAKRVALDTVESIFAGLSNELILRSELQRLFEWLKDHGLTAVITGERGDRSLTRHGLEEYVSDCVILLDHRVTEQISTRRLRVVKFRGSAHGVDEYPFLIGETGMSVLPVTSLGLEHVALTDRVSSGTPELDAMLGGKGFFRGSSIMISGAPGTGKSSLAASFAQAAGRRGQRCLYLAFEESASQIIRNTRSVGLDLEPLVESGLLRIESRRPSFHGLEHHLVAMHQLVDDFKPDCVVFDPLSNLMAVGEDRQVKSMLTRLIEFLKSKQATAFCTNLVSDTEEQPTAVSSLMDTVIELKHVPLEKGRLRTVMILKSRGMATANDERIFSMDDSGIHVAAASRTGGANS